MTTVTVLPSGGNAFVDARREGRSLRLSWHPEHDVFVLSMWRTDTCAATFQLSRSDAPALLAGLAEGLAERPDAPWSVTHVT